MSLRNWRDPADVLRCHPCIAGPAELQAAKPGIVRLGGPDGRHTTTHACFADCRQGRWGTLTLSPTGTDGTAFTGRYTLPLFLPDPGGSPQPLGTAAYELGLACVSGEEKGCNEHPQVSVQLRVTALAPPTALAWTALPAASPVRMPVLGGFATTATDPCARQVSTGFLAGQNGLLRSGDAGGHWGADRHRTLQVPLPTGKKRGGAWQGSPQCLKLPALTLSCAGW